MIEVSKTKLDGVLKISGTMFEDHRGEYREIYNLKEYNTKGININFIQDDISVSTRNVLRGVHGDNKTWKLVSCLHGKFYLVVLNYDPLSSDYGEWDSFILSEKNNIQILIPPKYGNGHLVLSDTAIFHYKQSTEYDPKSQFTIKWDDDKYGIWWPTKNPILSYRDEVA